MYVIPATVPIYREGGAQGRLSIASDWLRALELLRDSLGGRYGALRVLGPWQPFETSEQVTRSPVANEDAIELVPLFDNSTRLKAYWSGGHRQAMAVAREQLQEARVVHGTVEESLRPYCYASFMHAVQQGVPGVFIQDQDVAEVTRELHRHDGAKARLMAELYARAHEHQCRRAIAAAGVSFLKGRTTMQRYRGCSPHMHAIDDTSYLSREIADRSEVNTRLQSLLTTDRPLRFGFCGRLIDIKGVDRSLRIVHAARQAGACVALDIIGSGPQAQDLHALAAQLGLGTEVVDFVGAMDYGPALLQRLARCDALLFNPRMEETPRMIFDGYAAGLPLIAGGIEYVRERVEADRAGVVLPRDDDDAAARKLLELDRNRSVFERLTAAALDAAEFHAADTWYARRAQWTHEMVARHAQRHGR